MVGQKRYVFKVIAIWTGTESRLVQRRRTSDMGQLHLIPQRELMLELGGGRQ